MNGLNARLLCVRTLIRSIKAKSYFNLALTHALMDAEELTPQDTALCLKLYQGTLERLLTLDACIKAPASRPPEKLDTEVLCVLRCGFYELLYLHTPESAVVNLWTEAVKKLKKTSASGLSMRCSAALSAAERKFRCRRMKPAECRSRIPFRCRF